MAMILKQSTAVDVLIGPFIDDTDGKTAETALTLAQADIKLSKNGQALAQKTDDTSAAADANGYYNCELDATDTNTVGSLVLIVHQAGSLPVRHEFQVVEEAVYVALFAASATGLLPANMTQIGGVAQSMTDLKDFVDTGYDPATHKVAGVVLADTTTTNTDMRGTDSANTTAPLDAAGIRTAVGMASADLDTQLDAVSSISKSDVQDAMTDQGYTEARAVKIDYLDAAISGVGGAVGAGAISWTHTITDSDTGLPIADVDVWVSTDSAGSNVIAGALQTNASGVVTFMLDAGTYYFWHQKSGINFDNPDAEVVS